MNEVSGLLITDHHANDLLKELFQFVSDWFGCWLDFVVLFSSLFYSM